MDRKDSEWPIGQSESRNVSDNERSKKEKQDVGAKKFTPAENDRKVTVEDFYEFVASEKKAKLEKFINAYCVRFSLDHAAANDICSQTLADVLKAIHDGKKLYESKFEGLLRTIAFRLVIQELKVRTKNGYGASYSNDNSENQEFEFDSLPERRCASPEVIACLKDALEKLDFREQRVFILDDAGFGDEEIAEQLKVSKENVRTIRCRATQRLNK
jgi:RNA polymerase sigma factor (sigma-70 family)